MCHKCRSQLWVIYKCNALNENTMAPEAGDLGLRPGPATACVTLCKLFDLSGPHV